MKHSIGTTPVREVMTSALFCVAPTDKIESVAQQLDIHDINAAPVVDGLNVCLGVITSHDVVEYEAKRSTMDHGSDFQMGHTAEDGSFSIIGCPFDEAAYHMSTNVTDVSLDWPISRAAKTMCEKHVTHLIVLDEFKHPVGIISTLDILGFMIGVPVIRAEKQSNDN